MSFTNPKVGYTTIRNNIIALLRGEKTKLNSGLTKTFTSNTQIEPGDPAIKPIYRGEYPYIMIEFVGKDEEDRGVGAAHTKVPIITYRIYGAVSLRKNYEDLDAEAMNLLDNIEGLIRDGINSIDGALWILPKTSEKVSGEAKGTYITIISLEVEVAVEVS